MLPRKTHPLRPPDRTIKTGRKHQRGKFFHQLERFVRIPLGFFYPRCYAGSARWILGGYAALFGKDYGRPPGLLAAEPDEVIGVGRILRLPGSEDPQLIILGLGDQSTKSMDRLYHSWLDEPGFGNAGGAKNRMAIGDSAPASRHNHFDSRNGRAEMALLFVGQDDSLAQVCAAEDARNIRSAGVRVVAIVEAAPGASRGEGIPVNRSMRELSEAADQVVLVPHKSSNVEKLSSGMQEVNGAEPDPVVEAVKELACG